MLPFDPQRRRPHWTRVEPATSQPAVRHPGDEPRFLKHPQVAGNGRQGNAERLGQLAHRALAGGEPGDDLAPRGVRERGERGVEGVDIVNHVVNY